MNSTRIVALIKNKWEAVLLLLTFLLAYALRFYFLSTYHYPMMIHEQDAVGYMDVAKKIMQLQPLDAWGRPPGYPAVIALFSLLPVELEYAARLASIFMDALIVLPMYFLARIYLSRISSFAACILWAFFSFSLFFSTSPLSQSSYVLYLLAGIVFVHKGLEKKHPGWICGAGALFALSFLARPEGIVGFTCGIILCVLPLFKRDGVHKSTYAIPIVFLLGFLLLAAPYFINFHHQMGYWGITAKTEAALKTQDGALILDSKGELERTKQGESVWKEYYHTLPNFMSAVVENIKAYFNVYSKTFPLWMHILSIAGTIYILWGKRLKLFPYILILLAVTAPNYVVNVSKTHSYLYSLFPAMFICFIAGIESVVQVSKWAIEKYVTTMNPSFYKIGFTVILIITVSYASFVSYKLADYSYQGEAEEANRTERIFKEAGEFIKSNSQANEVIMTRWGLVGYFAGRPVVTLPKGGVKEVIDYGRKNGARYLLIDSLSVLSRRQELMELLGPLNGVGVKPEYGIEIVSRNLYPDVGGYVIYRYVQQRS